MPVEHADSDARFALIGARTDNDGCRVNVIGVDLHLLNEDGVSRPDAVSIISQGRFGVWLAIKMSSLDIRVRAHVQNVAILHVLAEESKSLLWNESVT